MARPICRWRCSSKAAGGLKLRHLPTNGGGPAITALLGNNAQAAARNRSPPRSPRSRPASCGALAAFGAKRSKALPDVPTLKELGYDVEYYLWVGLFAPKGTPPQVVSVLRAGINKAVHAEQFKTALTNLGQDLGYLDQPEFAKFWDADAKRVEDAVDEIGRVQG